jgi:hypothetical protein
MACRFLSVSGLVLLIAGVASAQTDAKSAEQLTKDVQELQQKLTNTAANLQILAEQVAKNTDAGTKNSQDITQLTNAINAELKLQRALFSKMDGFIQQQQEQLDRQQATLDAIVRKDSAGRDVLQLSANMDQSNEFREEVRKVVHEALDTHGELTIWNRMGDPQQVLVNQKPYDIAADEMLTLTVPVGTVTAQLPGQPITNWTLGAPNYHQKIEIVPESDNVPTKVARPISDPPSSALVPLPVRIVPLPSTAIDLSPPRPLEMPYYVWPF